MSVEKGSQGAYPQASESPMKENTFKPIEDTEDTESGGDKGETSIDNLTADSDVKAPGMLQRVKEEVQAIGESIYERIVKPKKGS